MTSWVMWIQHSKWSATHWTLMKRHLSLRFTCTKPCSFTHLVHHLRRKLRSYFLRCMPRGWMTRMFVSNQKLLPNCSLFDNHLKEANSLSIVTVVVWVSEVGQGVIHTYGRITHFKKLARAKSAKYSQHSIPIHSESTWKNVMLKFTCTKKINVHFKIMCYISSNNANVFAQNAVQYVINLIQTICVLYMNYPYFKQQCKRDHTKAWSHKSCTVRDQQQCKCVRTKRCTVRDKPHPNNLCTVRELPIFQATMQTWSHKSMITQKLYSTWSTTMQTCSHKMLYSTW